MAMSLNLETIVLVAEDGGGSVAPSTPRYEPSWFYDEIGNELIRQCMRPRQREPLEPDVCEFLHKRLLSCGHDANARGHHYMAHSWFDTAFLVKDDLNAFISSINMRLRLGQCTLASCLYEQLLQGELTEAQREVVVRKLSESTQEKSSRQHAPKQPAMQDEVAQLLAPTTSEPPAVASPDERAQVVRLLRQCGHAANGGGDCEAAHMAFDCAYALSQQPADLLSGANMRVKVRCMRGGCVRWQERWSE